VTLPARTLSAAAFLESSSASRTCPCILPYLLRLAFHTAYGRFSPLAFCWPFAYMVRDDVAGPAACRAACAGGVRIALSCFA